MKKLLLTLIFITALTLAQQTQAQEWDLTKIQKPDFPFEPMFLDNSYQMTSLPDEIYDVKVKAGIGTAKSYYQFNGANSTFRHSTSPLTLVVNQGLVNGTEVSVKDTYKLYKTEVKKDKRMALLSSFKVNVSSTPEDIPIEFKKVTDGVWLLTLKNLAPGEYVIFTVQQNKAYTLGID
jgi:hypothetical protein